VQLNVDTVVVGRSCPANYRGAYVQADLLTVEDFPALMKRVQATHLMHLAWYTEHGKYWSSPLNLRWVEASVRLVEAFCKAGGEKIVIAGSCAEYDWSFGYCREDTTPLIPTTLYGTAKDVTRRLVASICSVHEIPYAWGRLFYLYGPGEDSRRLIPSLIQIFRGERPPFGVNGSAYRDFLHVEDAATGFVRLLLSDASGCFNISSGQPIQIAAIVRILAEALNADPSIVLDMPTDRPGEPYILIGDNGKLKALGWQTVHVTTDITSLTRKHDAT
jgi:nucleoside-diphosphate-sugar epimerase